LAFCLLVFWFLVFFSLFSLSYSYCSNPFLIVLSFFPLCEISSDLSTPNMSIKSNAPASMFAFPPDVTAAQPAKARKTGKAVLSTTLKQVRLQYTHDVAVA
jgi:hypothetical protein